ncbi:MAG TPA: PIN domain-containing protein [bacterium]|jgi:predicted nucleic acid-binding protein|nr:PIN domain-containing protein [bacterium]
MAAEILVDTSVWIDFFRKPDSEVGEKIIRHLKRGSLSTCGVVVFEVLQGAADPEEFSFLEENLKGLHYLDANAEIFFEAGKSSYDLRKHGVTLPLSDILIATLALSHRQTLWTKDQHFKKIKGLPHQFF